jgi:hypothetical protein
MVPMLNGSKQQCVINSLLSLRDPDSIRATQ